MAKEIDWEQRRYEIAKEIMPVCIHIIYDSLKRGNKLENGSTVGEEACFMAKHYVDALISELKGDDQKEIPAEARQDGIFVTDLYDLDVLSVRALSVLRALGVRYIKDLKNVSKNNVLSIRGVGKGTFKEIDDFYKKYGLEWKRD